MRWDDAAWRAWRPDEAAERLAGLAVPWCVAAGWALDLFAGEPRREHEDLEVAVPAHAFPSVQAALGELEWHAPAGDGELLAPAAAPERLEDTHQTIEDTHQTWASTGRRTSGVSTSSASRRRAVTGSAAATGGSGCPTAT